MFLKTMRLTRRRAVFYVLAAGVALAAIILTLGASDRRERGIRSGAVYDRDSCAAYLQKLGWTVETETAECRETVIPRSFDGVFSQYAALQREQGFSLADYCGETVQLYSMRVTNYEGAGDCEVWATVLVCHGRVIGGDIHSTALNGFMHALG